MPDAIITPLTQALRENKITRAELRDLMQRRNGPAFVHLTLWAAVLAASSAMIWLAYDSWMIWPAMFVHGIVLVHHFSLQHECVHYTVFRTRRLNDVIGNICGAIIILPHQFFRYEHCDHHTHTQIEDHDPELVPMPQTFGQYLWYLSAIPYWRTKFSELFRHALGRITPHERKFLPKVADRVVVLEAQAMAALYLGLIVLMLITGWTGPIWFWFMPLVLGEPVMRFIRMTEHVGRPTVAQMSDNTRTNLVSLPWRFLAWNMNYHAEHHYVASVPYHALPRLHEKLKDHIHVQPKGYLGAHRDILRQVFDRPRT
ncbi:MAG: fatty acid desaturase family protein [Paracoccaceae bacterium]